MGIISFRLPPGLPSSTLELLKSASIAGGFDNVPSPTQVRLNSREIHLRRPVDESGFLVTPWPVDGVGTLMVQTTSLMERHEPYILSVELVRGKLHHVRNQVSRWSDIGLPLPSWITDELHELNRQFARLLAQSASDSLDAPALDLLSQVFRYADRMMRYGDEVLHHFRVTELNADVSIGCSVWNASSLDDPRSLFDHVRMELPWRAIEPTESQYDWSSPDALVRWAEQHSMPLSAGPLVNFSKIGIPDWLWIWQGDLANLAHFMCDYVETVVSRYRAQVKRWLICSGCNVGGALGFGEDELLWLTTRLVEAVQQLAPEAELVVGVTQPWGDYMALDEHTYSPTVFLDTLLRTNLKVSGMELEVVLGVSPAGSYWRDLLDTSRMLDHFADLGTPVEVTLGIPADDRFDNQSDPDARVGLGHWSKGYSPEVQAERGIALMQTAAAKPFVSHVVWTQLSDAVPHRHPHCGLFDAAGSPRPIVNALRDFRERRTRIESSSESEPS